MTPARRKTAETRAKRLSACLVGINLSGPSGNNLQGLGRIEQASRGLPSMNSTRTFSCRMRTATRFLIAAAGLWFGAVAIAAAPTTLAAQEKPASRLLIAPKAAPKAAPSTNKRATETAPEIQGTREVLPTPTAVPPEPEASAAPPKRSTLLEVSPGPTPLPPDLETPPPQPAAQPLTQGGAQTDTAVQDIRLPEPAEAPPAPPETFAPARDNATEAATVPTGLPAPMPTPEPAEPVQAVSRGKDADRLTDPSAPPAPPSLDEIGVTPPSSASPPGNGDVSEPEVSASESAAIATGTPGTATRPIISILFQPGSAELSDSGKSALTSLAVHLQDAGRVELLAFAAGDGKSTSKPRRLSLSRAQVVRGYLAEKGIPATSMIIRALGDNAKSGPPDRVDVRAQGS